LANPRRVAARPTKIADENYFDRILVANENDRDGRRRRFRCERRYRPTSGSDRSNLTPDQIDRERWQPIIVTFRPPVLNGKVPPLDLAGVFETFLKGRDQRSGFHWQTY
jgi:hypothetical protein